MALQHNKITNLSIAAARLNGMLLQPGQTLSFWRAVGKPTRRKGYLEGMVLSNGRVASGVGGGLCQLTNLLYWITLHTPLTITERYRHGYDVFPDAGRTQPFGSGATCHYNYFDLMIRNDTPQPFQLRVTVQPPNLCGGWYAAQPNPCEYKVYEVGHHFTLEAWGGYSRHNQLYRQITYRATGHTTRELVAENHAIMMYSPLLSAPLDI